VPDEDALYCAKVIRHAAIGAMIGGPLAALAAWAIATRLPVPGASEGPREGPPIALIAAAAALLFGVWLGATISCAFIRPTTAEEKCYGGGLGCLVYMVGGLAGYFLGTTFAARLLPPLAWYLIGGTVLAMGALVFACTCPQIREAVRSRARRE